MLNYYHRQVALTTILLLILVAAFSLKVAIDVVKISAPVLSTMTFRKEPENVDIVHGGFRREDYDTVQFSNKIIKGGTRGKPQWWNLLSKRDVHGDGNCMFRAFSDQLYGTQCYHLYIRRMTVELMRLKTREFACFVDNIDDPDSNFEKYLDKIANQGEWSDDRELRALSILYDLPIEIYDSNLNLRRTFYDEDSEASRTPSRKNTCSKIRILWDENPGHYSSVFKCFENFPLSTSDAGYLEITGIKRQLLSQYHTLPEIKAEMASRKIHNRVVENILHRIKDDHCKDKSNVHVSQSRASLASAALTAQEAEIRAHFTERSCIGEKSNETKAGLQPPQIATHSASEAGRVYSGHVSYDEPSRGETPISGDFRCRTKVPFVPAYTTRHRRSIPAVTYVTGHRRAVWNLSQPEGSLLNPSGSSKFENLPGINKQVASRPQFLARVPSGRHQEISDPDPAFLMQATQPIYVPFARDPQFVVVTSTVTPCLNWATDTRYGTPIRHCGRSPSLPPLSVKRRNILRSHRCFLGTDMPLSVGRRRCLLTCPSGHVTSQDGLSPISSTPRSDVSGGSSPSPLGQTPGRGRHANGVSGRTELNTPVVVTGYQRPWIVPSVYGHSSQGVRR